ncbi:AAA family ATPase [Terrarubrum flagellatum]|uniref:AAA family ATPase n=1 Tax=Terrirubrum flagellatum TaxID=2895980 RepID=UPI003144E639
MRDALDIAPQPDADPFELPADVVIAPLPRISVQAFCETPALSAVIEESMLDRRMTRAHVKVNMGGALAALNAYKSAPTPNLLVIESGANGEQMLSYLDQLADLCDAATRVMIAGPINDVGFYRELTKRGVSDYLILPMTTLEFIQAASNLYTVEGAETVGRTIAVMGTKGGVGASTLAHNLAWAASTAEDVNTVIVDLDLGFGTAALDFDQDPPQGIADAVFAPDRLDANLVDRLLAKCSDKLSLLAAPALLDRVYDLQETAFDGVLDVLRSSTPCVVLDVPHLWTSWSRRVAIGADEVIIVAEPDLASFRNVKNIFGALKQARPNDRPPKLVVNKIGMPKRPELPLSDFAKVLEIEPVATIPFDANLFGSALNNGRMIMEVQRNGKVPDSFAKLATAALGRQPIAKASASFLAPLLKKMKRA